MDLDDFHINQKVLMFTSVLTVLDTPMDIMGCILILQGKVHATLSQAEPCVLITEATSGQG